LSTQPDQTSSTITFKGKSGERYRFQAWPMETKFKAVGGVYLITKRVFEDRTFTTKASHQALAIGQTPDLAVSLVSESERAKLIAQGANCICVCAAADEARRVQIEKDLIDGNEQWGGSLHYLFHPVVSEKAPGVST
jgi:hypothetical protein